MVHKKIWVWTHCTNSLPHVLITEMARGSCECSCLRLVHTPSTTAVMAIHSYQSYPSVCPCKQAGFQARNSYREKEKLLEGSDVTQQREKASRKTEKKLVMIGEEVSEGKPG